MRTRINFKAIRAAILDRHPESTLEPMSRRALAQTWKAYPGAPEDFLNFLGVVGRGTIGRAGFKIYGGPISPEFVFARSPKLLAKLKDVVFIGDDFAGRMIGYDTRRDWKLGECAGRSFGVIRSFGFIAEETRRRLGLPPRETMFVRRFVDLIADRFMQDEETPATD